MTACEKKERKKARETHCSSIEHKLTVVRKRRKRKRKKKSSLREAGGRDENFPSASFRRRRK